MTIVIVIVAAIAAVLLFAATRPNSFRIERTGTVNVPPDRVFPLLNDFHRWGAWSPWEKLDPDMRRTHSGAPSGVGAIYEWDGNKKAGAGRMEITQSSPNSKVTIKLDFLKPFAASNITNFVLGTEGGATRITWTMDGPSPFLNKLMGLFINFDKLVGKDFEAGLANLKRVAEQ